MKCPDGIKREDWKACIGRFPVLMESDKGICPVMSGTVNKPCVYDTTTKNKG